MGEIFWHSGTIKCDQLLTTKSMRDYQKLKAKTDSFMLSENPTRIIFETVVAIDPQQVRKIRVRQMDDVEQVAL